MKVIGILMVALALVLVYGVIANRTKRLTEKQIDALAVVATIEVALAFIAGVYLMGVS